MTRSALRQFAVAALALPLALGLAACGGGKEADNTGGLSGEPIAKVAPPAGKAWGEVVARTSEGGYRMGNPDAPIKLVEYGALTCSHCAEFAAKSATELRENFVSTGRVSFELRLFMLNAIDVPAALLATCGTTEASIPLSEQFWAWQPTMFENAQKAGDAQMQAAASQPPPASYAAIAKTLGMDQFFAQRGIAADQAKVCLANAAKASEFVAQTQRAGTEHNVTGTPTFLVNGQTIGTLSWEELRTRLQTMGAR